MKRFFLLILVLTFIPFVVDSQTNIKLPKPKTDGGMPLMEALSKRQSLRNFDSTKSMSLETLSNLLWAANGINRPESGKRTAPSAVNWQEIEIFVALKSGIYFFNHKTNELEVISQGDYRKDMGKQNFVGDASVVLIFVSNHDKMEGASEKAMEFYGATDCGNVSQNVYLFCASENLATVVLGMIDREKISKLLKLKDSQKVILTQPVGYSK